LANKPEHAALKAQLTKHLPTTNLPESEGKTKPKNKPKNKKKKAE
jgi:hypothetical protein